MAALLPSRSPVELKELPAVAIPVAVTPPAPPPAERYIHPELTGIEFEGNGSYANLVRWALRRMTIDFSAHDINEMLQREGRPLGVASISTVLTRLKRRGEIDELKPGAGQNPAIIRCPNPPSQPPTALPEESHASLVG